MPEDASRRWMTYAEIATALNLPSAKAGEAKARRAKWERTLELRERLGRSEGEAAALRVQVEAERNRAASAEGELEKARLGRAAAEVGMQGLREALAEAKRPFWRRWLGVAALCAGSVLLPVIASAQETYS